MGVKGGNRKMDANEVVAATATLNVVKQSLDESCAAIENQLKRVEESNILEGGQAAANITEAYKNIRDTVKKAHAYTAKISEFTDKLAVDIEEVTHANIGNAAVSASEEMKSKTVMTR